MELAQVVALLPVLAALGQVAARVARIDERVEVRRIVKQAVRADPEVL
jgi:hypothetical protein